MKKAVVFIFSLWVMAMQNTNAQSAIVPIGGDMEGSGVTVSYTIGQIAVQSYGEGSTRISEGVQQPYEIQTIGIDNYPGVILNAMVYPNPTLGNVQLTMNNVQFEGEVKVFDTNGKLLFAKKIEGITTEIPMSDLATGTYFVNVVSEKQILKTFKVVKMAQ